MAERQPKRRHVLEPGCSLSERYRIVAPVGTGAVGAVVRASDTELDREIVALKVLHPHLCADEAVLARFENEVLIARQLSHPNIVRVYDLDRDPEKNVYFLAMECIRGPNLREYLDVHKGRMLEFDDAVRITEQLASALSYAHQKGTVHRDIKPENVLMSRDGYAKLGDFGLASSLETSRGLTATGESLGTPLYMAPEVFQGKKATIQSDLYSLGVLMYEMAAGRPPFSDESYYTLAKRHLAEPLPEEPLIEARVPVWFIELLRRICAKEPSSRPRSAEEVRDALRVHAADTLVTILVKVKRAGKHRTAQPLVPYRFSRWTAVVLWIALGFSVASLFGASNTHPRKEILLGIYQLESAFGWDFAALKLFLGFPALRPDAEDAVPRALAARDPVAVRALAHLAERFQKFPAPGGFYYRNPDGLNSLHLGVLTADIGMIDSMQPEKAGTSRLVEERNAKGQTPMVFALDRGLLMPAQILLYRYFANPYQEDNSKNNALHLAVAQGFTQLASHILNAHRIHMWWRRNKAGATPLHIAAAKGRVETLVQMLEHKVDPNLTDNRGRTPLMLALQLPAALRKQMARPLLIAGADVYACDFSRKCVLDYAREAGADEDLAAAMRPE